MSKKFLSDLLHNSICMLKLPFLASLSLNFSTVCAHMLSKFFDKSAQKTSIFLSKANYARGLFLFVFCFSTCVFAQSGNFKAIIFDCDGVLIDNGNGYFLDWQHALHSQGYELSQEVFWEFMHKNELVGSPHADAAILDFCCDLLGYDCKEQLKKEKDAFSKELHKKGFPPVVDTIELLRDLYKTKETHKCKIAVASASSKEYLLRQLSRLGIDRYFDLIVSGQDDLGHYRDPDGVNKPKPYIYQHTAQKLSVEPSQCIVIEDSKTGLLAASTAGCFTVVVPTRATCKQDLSLANIRVDSFAGVSSPAFFDIIHTISEKKMTEPPLIAGVYAAALTPMNDDLSCNYKAMADHCHDLIDRGCQGVVLFGATGEGCSFSVEEREKVIKSVIQLGVKPEKIIVGIICPSVTDAIKLASIAVQQQCAAVLVVPPFFYKNADERGVIDFYRKIIQAAHAPQLKILLYHLPQHTGVPITLNIVRALKEEFPDTVIGVKESEGNLAFTKEILSTFADCPVFVGNELHISEAVQLGAMGGISGIANAYPELIVSLYKLGLNQQQPNHNEATKNVIQALKNYSLFPAIKSIVESQKGTDWHSVRPPLVALNESQRKSLSASLKQLEQ